MPWGWTSPCKFDKHPKSTASQASHSSIGSLNVLLMVQKYYMPRGVFLKSVMNNFTNTLYQGLCPRIVASFSCKRHHPTRSCNLSMTTGKWRKSMHFLTWPVNLSHAGQRQKFNEALLRERGWMQESNSLLVAPPSFWPGETFDILWYRVYAANTHSYDSSAVGRLVAQPILRICLVTFFFVAVSLRIGSTNTMNHLLRIVDVWYVLFL